MSLFPSTDTWAWLDSPDSMGNLKLMCYPSSELSKTQVKMLHLMDIAQCPCSLLNNSISGHNITKHWNSQYFFNETAPMATEQVLSHAFCETPWWPDIPVEFSSTRAVVQLYVHYTVITSYARPIKIHYTIHRHGTLTYLRVVLKIKVNPWKYFGG